MSMGDKVQFHNHLRIVICHTLGLWNISSLWLDVVHVVKKIVFICSGGLVGFVHM